MNKSSEWKTDRQYLGVLFATCCDSEPARIMIALERNEGISTHTQNYTSMGLFFEWKSNTSSVIHTYGPKFTWKISFYA